MTEPLLEVRNLQTRFRVDEGTVHAVDGVSFDIERGETVCLVGESGSGKSVTCESLTRLVSTPPGSVTADSIRFAGQELTTLDNDTLRELRGSQIAYVFQNPQNALDPVFRVGEQLIESVTRHTDLTGDRARERAISLLTDVGIPTPSARMRDYPHQFSGGMRQRVLIAMALAGEPDLLIADEPTTAVDVTVEAGILTLLQDLQAETGMSVLFVTHDLGVVAEIADRVVVLYGGTVMERGDVLDLFDDPLHPYTRALFRCLPGRETDLEPIGGEPVDALDPPAGCRFHPRCDHAVDACREGDQPPLHHVRDGHRAACVFYGPDRDPSTLELPDRSGEDA